MSLPRSLKARLTLGMLVVAVLPLIMTGWYATSRLASDMEADIHNRNLLLAQSIAGEVERFVEAPLNVLRSVQHELDAHGGTAAEVTRLLEHHAQFHPYFLSLFVLDGNGIVRHHYPFDRDYELIDMSTQEFFRAARSGGGPYWSPASMDIRTGQPSSTLVLAGKQRIIVAYLDLVSLGGIIARARIGPGGVVAIVDQEGSVISHQETRAVLEQWNIRSHPAVAQALEGRDGSYRSGAGENAELASVARVPHTGWIVMVSQRTREAFAPVRTIRMTVTVSVILAAFMGIVIAVFMLNRMLNPLARLTAGARQVAGGDYAVRLPAPAPGSSAEPAELTTTFNAMLDAVHVRQQALAESEEKFEKAFRSSPDAIAITTLREGRIIDLNEGFGRALGHALPEAVNRTVLELGIWASAAERTAFVEELQLQGRVRDREVLLRTKDGSERACLLSAETVDLRGERCVVSIIRDVTDQKRLQAQFIQAQKMESVGRLAGGVAHDFNNILSAILGFTDLALLRLPADAPVRGHLEMVKESSARAAALTRQLLAFSRKQELKMEPTDLNALIGGVSKMLGRLIGEDINFVMQLGGHVGRIMADSGQIEQVLMNLCVNARDAMPAGGNLVIETDRLVLEENAPAGPKGLRPGVYAVLTVSDSGAGMDEKVRERIFEPFYTTKETGKGTGLGLATVYGIVQQHNGTIEVASEPGKGTTFTICLPALGSDPSARTDLPQEQPRHPRGTETVLVVDDDATVRLVVAGMLGQLGYTVLEASNGAEALSLAAKQQAPVPLLLTDVIMPGMDGKQLARAFLTRWPSTRVVFMSGYADDRLRNVEGMGAGATLIIKPLSLSKLAAAVRTALD